MVYYYSPIGVRRYKMKRTIKVRVTNDSTGEIWEYPWYNCHSKFQAIRKMIRLMRKHISYSCDFNRIEVWEVSND